MFLRLLGDMVIWLGVYWVVLSVESKKSDVGKYFKTV
ncbi:variable large family protein [Borrelia persica]|nr:variable large family protein [Borrelia persica]